MWNSVTSHCNHFACGLIILKFYCIDVKFIKTVAQGNETVQKLPKYQIFNLIYQELVKGGMYVALNGVFI